MKKMFKRSLAAVMAVASLAVGMTGVAANAADKGVNANNSIADLYYTPTHSYTFSATSSKHWYSDQFYAYGGSFTISFQSCSPNPATLILRYEDGSEYGRYTIPTYSGTSLYVNVSPSAGWCYFEVLPKSGTKTEGSFSTNA